RVRELSRVLSQGRAEQKPTCTCVITLKFFMPAGISSSVLCAMRFRSLDVSAPSDLMLLETCHATSCCLPCRAPTQDATWYGTAVIQASTLFRNCRMHGAQLQQTLGCADQHK
ncbi:unnamed protein product, partial [Ectocarpus sp. 12 AP-2014]